MGKINDKSTMSNIILYIDRYAKGEIELMELIQTLEGAFNCLESVDNNWKKLVLGDWIELEIILSSVLERDYERMVIIKEEKLEIDEILSSLKDKIQKRKDAIEEHYCPSCGMDLSDSSAWDTESIEYDHCPCCGLKFSRKPSLLGEVCEKRDRWLLHPDFWHNQKEKPDEWNIEKQMEHIPRDYM